MFSATLEMATPGAKKLYEGVPEEEVQELISTVMNKGTLKIEATIKQPGYAPRDNSAFGEHGLFAARHISQLDEKMVKYITNSERVSNGEFLWKYVVGGHRVLTTPKSRKWWFWHLHHELGGVYERKTPGQSVLHKGQMYSYVPPDNYVKRAYNTVVQSGYIGNVAKQELTKFWSGQMPGGMSNGI